MTYSKTGELRLSNPVFNTVSKAEQLAQKQAKSEANELKEHKKNLLFQAKELRKAGFSIIAVNDNKIACHKWTKHQESRIALGKIANVFKPDYATGLALVCGSVSGTPDSNGKPLNSLECLDFDLKHDESGNLFERFAMLVQKTDSKLWDSLTIQRTRSGGFHIIYLCAEIEGNQKIAFSQSGKCVIETRGKGGYFLTSPSKGYKIEQGNIKKLPFISREQRKVLMDCAKSLDESPKAQESTTHSQNGVLSQNTETSQDFNRWLSKRIENSLSPIRKAPDSMKHDALLASSITLGGYVGGGHISYSEAERMLKDELAKKQNVKSFKNAYKTIQDGLGYGMKKPFTTNQLLAERHAFLTSKTKSFRTKKKRYLVEDYISKTKVVEQELMNPNGCGRISINAPTGSGKTRAIIESLHLVSSLNSSKSVIVLPYKALPSQIATEYANYNVIAISGGATDEQISEARQANIVAVTYDSFSKVVTDPKDIDFLIIDEAHNLVNQYSFRDKALLKLQKFFNGFSNVILISATPNPHFDKIGFRSIIFERSKNPKVSIVRNDYEKGSAIDAVLIELLNIDFSKGLVAVKINSKKNIDTIKAMLTSKGKLGAEQIATIYDHHLIDEDANYQGIIEDSLLKPEIRLLLTTSKINDGVNIYNTDVQRVIVVNEICTDSFIQFIARFRRLDKISVSSFRRFDKSKEQSKINQSYLLRRYKKDAQTIADIFNKSNSDAVAMGMPKQYIQANANQFLYFDENEYKVNDLAILFAIKSQSDSLKTVDEFYNELSERCPYISVVNQSAFEVVKNEERQLIEEDIKETEEKARESALKLITEHLNLFLSSLWFITKDIQTKSKIVSFLGYEPTKSVELDSFMAENLGLMRFAAVNRLAVVFLRLIDFKFTKETALKLLSIEGFTSVQSMKRFTNGLMLHSVRYISEKYGSNLIPQQLLREFNLIEKNFGLLETKTGQTLTSNEVSKLVNSNRRFLADRLKASQVSDLVSYGFNYEKGRVKISGKTERVSHLIERTSFAEFCKSYDLSENEQKRVLDNMVSNHLENSELAHDLAVTPSNIFSVKDYDTGCHPNLAPIDLPYEGFCNICGF